MPKRTYAVSSKTEIREVNDFVYAVVVTVMIDGRQAELHSFNYPDWQTASENEKKDEKKIIDYIIESRDGFYRQSDLDKIMSTLKTLKNQLDRSGGLRVYLSNDTANVYHKDADVIAPNGYSIQENVIDAVCFNGTIGGGDW